MISLNLCLHKSIFPETSAYSFSAKSLTTLAAGSLCMLPLLFIMLIYLCVYSFIYLSLLGPHREEVYNSRNSDTGRISPLFSSVFSVVAMFTWWAAVASWKKFIHHQLTRQRHSLSLPLPLPPTSVAAAVLTLKTMKAATSQCFTYLNVEVNWLITAQETCL